MHVAVCSANINERYELSRLVDDMLLKKGMLSEISLFPILSELLLYFTEGKGCFDLIIVTEMSDHMSLKSLCRQTAVITVGDKHDGPEAFEVGAEYFLESPVDSQQLDKALKRHFQHRKISF